MDPHCEEFKRLLLNSGWTKAEAARQLGLAPSVVTRYVQGVTRPSITVLRLMAGSIGDRVLTEDPGAKPVQFKDDARFLEDWESEAMLTLRRMQPKSRKAVIKALGEIVVAISGQTTYRVVKPTDPAEAAPPSGSAALETEAAGMKRVAEQLGSALGEAVKVLRSSETGASDGESTPPVRDPSRPTSQRSLPRQRRGTTQGPSGPHHE